MEDKIPDRLYCTKEDKDIYDTLRKEGGPFKGKDHIYIFMMALGIGYKEKNRVKLTNKEGLILLYHVPKELKSIMNAIAVAEEGKNLSIVADKKKVYTIAEEYATGGIRILKKKVFSGEFGSYIKKLESELMDEWKKRK